MAVEDSTCVLVLWFCIVLWMCVLDSRVDDIGTICFLSNHRVSGEFYIDRFEDVFQGELP